jgi:hypothetical protein
VWIGQRCNSEPMDDVLVNIYKDLAGIIKNNVTLYKEILVTKMDGRELS